MNIKGEIVVHKVFGNGKVTDVKKGLIQIKFDGYSEIKQFAYPDCVDKYIFFENHQVTELAQQDINKANNQKKAEEERKEAERKIALDVYRRDNKLQRMSSEPKKTEIPKFDNADDFCDYYVKKLQSEIIAVKTNNSKRTALMDGSFLEIVNGRYFYEFESDAELSYPNETPISIWEGETEHEGVIESIFEFTVIISTAHDFGHDKDTEIPSIEFTAEQWRLIQSLCDKVSCLRLINSSMVKAIVEDGRKKLKPGESIRTGQDTAVQMATSQPITFIWGPPGTGKTYTLARIAEEFIKQDKHVLMLSYSNVSVDGALIRLYDRLTEDGKKLEPGKILRFGYPKDEKIKDHAWLSSYNYVMKKNPDLYNKSCDLKKEHDRIKRNKTMVTRRIEIEKELKQIRRKLTEYEKEAIKNSSFVATTVTKAVIDSGINTLKFDAVIFDEASMSYVPQIAFGAGLASEHFICMGDFCQLPPIVQGEYSKELAVDIFAYCGITEAVQRKRGHEWLCMLDVQRRMHSKIAELPSRVMYSGLLKTAAGIDGPREEIGESVPQIKDPCGMFDLSGMLSVSSRTKDQSRINILSALITFSISLQSYNEGFEVGIITPYSAQSRLLHCMAIDQRDRYGESNGIAAATVHQFQGSERDVIVYDAVDCYRSQYPGTLLTSMTDNYANRLFNVAMTRARGKFVGVANVKYLVDKNLSENLMFGQMIRRIQDSNRIDGSHLKDISIDPKSCISFYDSPEAHKDFFSDLIMAKKSVFVDITDAPKEDEAFYTEFLTLIEKIKKNGVKVVVRAENKQNLPDGLRKIAVENKNVLNPIVIIDKMVLWYGMPETKSDFIAEGRVIPTKYRPIFRFEGRKTARAVYSMLGMEKTTDQTKVLGTGEINSFSDYVLANEKCKICGKPMMLKKSHKGKYFLSCTGYPGCESTTFVEEELVNKYLFSNDGKSIKHCNQCGMSIEAKTGRYGVYITCCGMNEHKYKLDEI